MKTPAWDEIPEWIQKIVIKWAFNTESGLIMAGEIMEGLKPEIIGAFQEGCATYGFGTEHQAEEYWKNLCKKQTE